MHFQEVEARRDEPEVGEDAINNHPQELRALVLERREELVKIDQVHGSIATASNLGVRYVRTKVGGKLVTPSDQRFEHALLLPRERTGHRGSIRSLYRLLHRGSHLLLHVLG